MLLMSGSEILLFHGSRRRMKGRANYLSRIKEFPLFIYLWHSNAEAIVLSRGSKIVFIVLGFEPVPTGFTVAIFKDNKNIKDKKRLGGRVYGRDN